LLLIPHDLVVHLQQNFCFWWLFFILILHSLFFLNSIMQPTHLQCLWTILQCFPTHLTFQEQHLFLSLFFPYGLTEHFLCSLSITMWPLKWHFFCLFSQTSGLFLGVAVYLNEAHFLQLTQHCLLLPNLPTGRFWHFLWHFSLKNGPVNLHFLVDQHLGALVLLQVNLSWFMHFVLNVQHLLLFPFNVLTWLHFLLSFVVITLPVHLHLLREV